MNYNEIVDKTKEIESMLGDLGATGKGLHAKASSLENIITDDLMNSIRAIATIRNKLLHEDGFALNENICSRFLKEYIYIKNNINQIPTEKNNIEINTEKNPESVLNSNKNQQYKNEIPSFTKIQLDGNISLMFYQSNTSTVSCDCLPLINTEVVNNVLRITSTSKKSEISVNCSSPQLHSIELRGPGDLSIDKLCTTNLDVTLTGSGDVIINDLNTDTLKINLLGAGDVIVHCGKSNKTTTTLHGAGDIDLRRFTSNIADVTLSGAGDILVSCKNNINATMLGVGDIHIFGNPTSRKTSTLGLGDIIFY